MVAYGVPQIIKYIQTNDNPTQLCQQLGLCSSEVTIEDMPKQYMCPFCELVVSYIEGWYAIIQSRI